MRKNLVISSWLVMLLLVAGATISAEAQKASQKMNVLFIVVDDMNKWSVQGDYPVLKVPAIQKLKSQSYYFANASCAAPVCVPSRASFLSGKYPHHSGVYRNGPEVWNTSALLTQVEAMPELFKRNGYTTWGAGKTFHVPLGDREKEMFDNEVFHGGYGPFAVKKGDWNDIKPWEGPDTDFTDVVSADAATAFLQSKHEKPFFMYYGLYRPHTPYTAPKRFYGLYDGVTFPQPPGYLKNDLADVPAMGKDLSKGLKRLMEDNMTKEEMFQRYLRAYCASTSFADWNVGRVLDALDKSAYAKNTIVIFTSDNGFHTGTKDHWPKQTLWEQADAIPLLIRLPGGRAFTCPQTVSLVDLYPTLVEYCGLAHPKQDLDGKSLVPIFKDPATRWERPGLTTMGENYASVRSEQYRYIRYPDGSEELYDHVNDPYEHTNIAADPAMKAVISHLASAIPDDFEKSVAVKKDVVPTAARKTGTKMKKGRKAGKRNPGK